MPKAHKPSKASKEFIQSSAVAPTRRTDAKPRKRQCARCGARTNTTLTGIYVTVRVGSKGHIRELDLQEYRCGACVSVRSEIGRKVRDSLAAIDQIRLDEWHESGGPSTGARPAIRPRVKNHRKTVKQGKRNRNGKRKAPPSNRR